jgi:hypothetical protein
LEREGRNETINYKIKNPYLTSIDSNDMTFINKMNTMINTTSTNLIKNVNDSHHNSRQNEDIAELDDLLNELYMARKHYASLKKTKSKPSNQIESTKNQQRVTISLESTTSSSSTSSNEQTSPSPSSSLLSSSVSSASCHDTIQLTSQSVSPSDSTSNKRNNQIYESNPPVIFR